jgi:hypothetical protein
MEVSRSDQQVEPTRRSFAQPVPGDPVIPSAAEASREDSGDATVAARNQSPETLPVGVEPDGEPIDGHPSNDRLTDTSEPERARASTTDDGGPPAGRHLRSGRDYNYFADMRAALAQLRPDGDKSHPGLDPS